MDRVTRKYIFLPKGSDKSSLFKSRESEDKSAEPAQTSGAPKTSHPSKQTNSDEPEKVEPLNSSKWLKVFKPSTYRKYDRM